MLKPTARQRPAASVSGNMVAEAFSSIFSTSSPSSSHSTTTAAATAAATSSSAQGSNTNKRQEEHSTNNNNNNSNNKFAGNARLQMTEDMILGSGNFSSSSLGQFSILTSATAAASTAHATSSVFDDEEPLVRDALDELDAALVGENSSSMLNNNNNNDDIIPEIAAALSKEANSRSNSNSQQEGSSSESITALLNLITERHQRQQQQQQQQQHAKTASRVAVASGSSTTTHITSSSSFSDSFSSAANTNTRVSLDATPAYLIGALPYFRSHLLPQLAAARHLVTAAANQLRLIPNAGCLGRQELRFLEHTVGRKLRELCEGSFAPNRDLLMLTSCSSSAVEAAIGSGTGGDLQAFVAAEERIISALQQEEHHLLQHGLPLRLDLQRGLIECSLLQGIASLFVRLEQVACVNKCGALVGAMTALCRVICKDGKKLAAAIEHRRAMYGATGAAAVQQQQQQQHQMQRQKRTAAALVPSSKRQSSTSAAAAAACEPLHAGDRTVVRKAQHSAARQGLNRHRPDVIETTAAAAATSGSVATSSLPTAEAAHEGGVSSSVLLFLDGTPTRKSSPSADEKARARAGQVVAAQQQQQIAQQSSRGDTKSASASTTDGRRHMFAPGMMPRFVKRLGAASNFNDVLLALRDVAPALDSGHHFVPLDALTAFASKYSCFVEHQKEQQHKYKSNNHVAEGGRGDLGRRIIKRLSSMQTTAVHHHVELLEASQKAHRSGAVPPRASSSSSSTAAAAMTTSSSTFGAPITNPRAAAESSIVIADLLLKHCDAPTLASQLINESSPIFSYYLNQRQQQQQQQQQEQEEDGGNSKRISFLEDPTVLDATRRRIAAVKIRAACAQQPPNWRVGLDNVELLLEEEQRKHNEMPTDCLVSDLRPLVALLESMPAHSMRPSEWLEFAHRFFPPPQLLQQKQQQQELCEPQQQQDDDDRSIGAVLEEFDADAEDAELERLEQQEQQEAKQRKRAAAVAAAVAASKSQAPATTILHGVKTVNAAAAAAAAPPVEQKQQEKQQLEAEPVTPEEPIKRQLDVEEQHQQQQQHQQRPVKNPLFYSTFAALCRNLVRAAEVHMARAQQQQHKQSSHEGFDSIATTLTTFVVDYHSHLVHVPAVTLTLLLALVNSVQVRRTVNEPTQLQRDATTSVASLLGPLLRAAKVGEQEEQQRQQQASSTPHFRVTHNSSRGLSICISSFLSKCNTAGLWHDALTLISTEIDSVRNVADARTWSVVAHAAHRPRPSNWAVALAAASHAFSSPRSNDDGNGGSRHSNDLDDMTETATGALRSLAHSDIAYSQRTELALKLFARTRALRHGEDDSGATKRMLAAAVDALSMRMPSGAQLYQPKKNKTSGGGGVATWTRATELFNSLVRSRAVDVTSASRWLRGIPFASKSVEPQVVQHREAERLWRGKFCGRGRLGDEQRLSSSLIRALSESSCRARNSSNSQQQHQEECYSTALMLCGGDASALLRACAQTGAWACALTGLVQLCNHGNNGEVAVDSFGGSSSSFGSTTATSSSASSDKPSSLLPAGRCPADLRRWIDDAALACVWAPNAAAYLAVRNAFPAAQLPPLVEHREQDVGHNHNNKNKTDASSRSSNNKSSNSISSGVRSPRGGNMPPSYTARDDEPGSDAQHYPPIAAINEELAKPHNEKHRSRMHGRGDAMLKQVAPFETQEIINLTEKIFLRQRAEEEEGKARELKR